MEVKALKLQQRRDSSCHPVILHFKFGPELFCVSCCGLRTDRLTRDIYKKKNKKNQNKDGRGRVTSGNVPPSSTPEEDGGTPSLPPSTRVGLVEGRMDVSWVHPSPTKRGPPPPPATHPESLSSLCPPGVSPVFSFLLQVVALRLAALRPVQAGQRLTVPVHAPAVAPPPAFGWTALRRSKTVKTLVSMVTMMLTQLTR